MCCKKTTIKNTEFDCGHVMSERNGGGQEITNLRPICSSCNKSMGTTNMIDFVKKHGFYIG
jgi:5-methylcytosine-specific restriction endonuclease McrA